MPHANATQRHLGKGGVAQFSLSVTTARQPSAHSISLGQLHLPSLDVSARVLHPKGFYALCRARHGVRVPPLRSGAPCLHCRRDAVDPQSLSLADVLARPFQQRFTLLIERNDAHQVARYGLIRATACLKPGCCTTAAFLKRRIHGALQHFPRDQGRLVRVSRREHEKGIHWCWRNGPAVLA